MKKSDLRTSAFITQRIKCIKNYATYLKVNIQCIRFYKKTKLFGFDTLVVTILIQGFPIGRFDKSKRFFRLPYCFYKFPDCLCK